MIPARADLLLEGRVISQPLNTWVARPVTKVRHTSERRVILNYAPPNHWRRFESWEKPTSMITLCRLPAGTTRTAYDIRYNVALQPKIRLSSRCDSSELLVTYLILLLARRSLNALDYWLSVACRYLPRRAQSSPSAAPAQ